MNTHDAKEAALPISDVADSIGIPDKALLRYGHDKAKVDRAWLAEQSNPNAKLVLVTAMSPTPAGEGKTTTSIGLADGLRQIGINACLALREPSMGPVFGMKGGATGGGKATIVPEAEINLHFTGDFAAIAQANNLLAALIDNHLHHGNALNINPKTVSWRRAIDVNDRSLRDIVTGLGGPANGLVAQSGFDITAASEIMAIFCLAEDLDDLRERLGNIVFARNMDGDPVTVADLGVEGALTAVLKDALSPNLVQSLEGTAAFIHGGPFANIAHGCNSIIATRAALALGDVAVTEAGFGADLGAEKFLDLKCRKTGLAPDLAVVVATVRALKYHGGVDLKSLETENVEAVRAGMTNLFRHVENLQKIFGQKVVVAINAFATDTEAEMSAITEELAPLGVKAVPTTHFADGGAGATELAKVVMSEIEAHAGEKNEAPRAYSDDLSLEDKAKTIVEKIYRGNIAFTGPAKKRLAQLQEAGYGDLPVCIAKTQYSFATTKLLGAPTDHTVEIREVRLSAGAGFIVLIAGAIMTMPGLSKAPAALGIDVTDGEITGIM